MMNRELHTRQQHPANSTTATTHPSSQCGGENGWSIAPFVQGRITLANKVFICSCLKSESKRNFLMIFLKLHKMHFIEY